MLRPTEIYEIPETTVRVARAAFPKGNIYLRIRDELGSLYKDENFAELYPAKGRPALPAWQLALVTVVQFKEGLSDRQAAEAVRARIDLKYLLGLELTDRLRLFGAEQVSVSARRRKLGIAAVGQAA